MTEVEIEHLRAPLLRYCAHLLRHHHDAEEVVQDVLLRLADGRGPAATEATAVWLFRCARNRCIDLRRKRRPAAIGETEAAVAAPPVGDDSDLQEAIAALPAAEREALVLTAIDGLGYREVAAILGCAVGTVASLRGAAIGKLRRRLSP